MPLKIIELFGYAPEDKTRAAQSLRADGKAGVVKGMIVRGIILRTFLPIPLTIIPLTLDFSG